MAMACWSCKSPDDARVIVARGVDGYFSGKWARLGSEIVNPMGCSGCYDTRSEKVKPGEPGITLTRHYVGRVLDVIGKKFYEP
ncbi:hypothetical protein UF29_00145 [Vibrio parahaemolyticus]|nr:hypothetical protein UF29_00145 [Vibrio parahaemolyticus]